MHVDPLFAHQEGSIKSWEFSKKEKKKSPMKPPAKNHQQKFVTFWKVFEIDKQIKYIVHRFIYTWIF